MVAVSETDAGIGPAGSQAIQYDPNLVRPGVIAEVFRTDAFGILADTNLVRIGNHEVDSIYNDWGSGSINGWGKDSVEIKYSGYFVPKVTGMYSFGLLADDDASLTLAGESLITDDLQPGSSHTATSQALPRLLEAGRMYPLKVHYMETTGGAEIALGYKVGDPNDAKFASAAWQPVTPDLLFHYEPPHPSMVTKDVVSHLLEPYAKADDLGRTAADVGRLRADVEGGYATKAAAEAAQQTLKGLILGTDARVEAASKELAAHKEATAAQLGDLASRIDQARADAAHAKEVLEAADQGLAATLDAKITELGAAKTEVLTATAGLAEKVAGVKADLVNVKSAADMASKIAADSAASVGTRVTALEKSAIPDLTQKLEAAVRGITSEAIPAVEAKLLKAVAAEEGSRAAADGAIQKTLAEVAGGWRTASDALEKQDALLRDAVRAEQAERTAQDGLIRGEFVARAEMQKAVAEVAKTVEDLRAESATKGAVEEVKAAATSGLRLLQEGLSRVEGTSLPQAVAALQGKDAELQRGLESLRASLDEQRAAADAAYAPRAALADAIKGVETRIGDAVQGMNAREDALTAAVREINEAKIPGLAAETAGVRGKAAQALAEEVAARKAGDDAITGDLASVAKEIAGMRSGSTDSFAALKREDDAIKANLRASVESLTAGQKALQGAVKGQLDDLATQQAATKSALAEATAGTTSAIAAIRDATAAAAAATDSRIEKLETRVGEVDNAAKYAGAKLAEDVAATAASIGTRVGAIEEKQAAWTSEAQARSAALAAAAEQQTMALAGRVGVLEERAQAVSQKVEAHDATLQNTAASVSAAHDAARLAQQTVDEKSAAATRALDSFSSQMVKAKVDLEQAKSELNAADRELAARVSGLESETRAKVVALEEADANLGKAAAALKGDVSSLGNALRAHFSSMATQFPTAEEWDHEGLGGEAWGAEAGAAEGALCAAELDEALALETAEPLDEEPVL